MWRSLASISSGVVAVNVAAAVAVVRLGGASDEMEPDLWIAARSLAWAAFFFALFGLAGGGTQTRSAPGETVTVDSTKNILGVTTWSTKFANRVCAFVHATLGMLTATRTIYIVHADAAVRTAAARSFLPIAYGTARDPHHMSLFCPVEITLGYTLFDFTYMALVSYT